MKTNTNIAFVETIINGVIFSEARLTSLGRHQYEESIRLTGYSLKCFLHLDHPKRIPNMDEEGWNYLLHTLYRDEKQQKAFLALISWLRVGRIVGADADACLPE